MVVACAGHAVSQGNIEKIKRVLQGGAAAEADVFVEPRNCVNVSCVPPVSLGASTAGSPASG